MDYTVITDDTSPWTFSPDLKRFLEEEIPMIQDPFVPEWKEFHWSTKAGPNGPALQYSLIDGLSLPENLKDDILIMAPELKSVFERLSNGLTDDSVIRKVLFHALKIKDRSRRIRRLSIKKDYEAKSRVFAILDYWSQSALYPLHKELFQILKRWSTDCTFQQAHGLTLEADKGHKYYSFDLSNATDRFPIKIQEFVLKCLIGGERAAAWTRIMVGHPFEAPGSDPVKYGRGQPMGAHSSGPLFTLTHHLMVQYANFKAGLPAPCKSYRILGDDIVIGNDDVAREYQKVMSEIGVTISPTKSHISSDCYEIAKKGKYLGSEVSPFPVIGFGEVAAKYHLVADLGLDSLRHGFSYLEEKATPVGAIILKESGNVTSRVSRKCHYLTGLIKSFICLSRLNSNQSDHERLELLHEFLKASGITLPCNWRDATRLRLLEVMASSVYYGKQEDMATMASTRVRHGNHAIYDEIEQHPSMEPSDQEELGMHGKVTLPMFGSLVMRSRESFDMVQDTIRASHMPDKFVGDKLARSKILTLPVESGVIPIRSSHLKAGATAAQVKDFRKELNNFLRERLIHVP